MKAYLSRSSPRTDMSDRDSDSVPGWEARFPRVPVGCGFPDPVEEEDTGGGGGERRGPEERDSARESRDSLDTLDVSELFTLFSIDVSHSFLGDNKPEKGRGEELVI